MAHDASSPLRRDTAPRLRLVPDGSGRKFSAGRAERVAVENRAASLLADDDARLIFANRVREQLQGGRVAMLSPDRRRSLVTTATRMGLRPFDANLVIAVVQDATRRGEPSDHPQTVGRLKMVPGAKRSKRHHDFMIAMIVTLMLSLAMMAFAIRWITGG